MVCGVLLDLSGVLYEGSRQLPGAQAALERLHAAGLAVRYVTNTTRSTRAMIVTKLRGLGLAVTADEIVTAPISARQYLRARDLRPYLLVHPDLMPEFADLDTEPPNAVLLGDAGRAFDYEHLNRAFRLLLDGVPLLALGRNRYFKEDGGLSLDAGPFVAALEYAAGVEAEIIGKPAPMFYEAALSALGCTAATTVMVGDDVEADVVGAVALGMKAVLVQTGKYRGGDETRLPRGAVLLPDIGAAVEWILGQASRAGRA